MTANCATNPALVPSAATPRLRRRSIPITIRSISTTRTRPENLEFLKRFPGGDGRVPGDRRRRRGRRQPARPRDRRRIHVGRRKVHMCYAFEFLAPDRLTPQRVAEVLRDFQRAAPKAGPAGLLEP
ncbi:hypothetical protein F2981_09400 [Sinorhizobium meliloti]|nr:hypothetical protein [Sinorhizobium meliloti]